MASRSYYSEQIVAAWFQECGLPAPIFEHVHVPGRRFRLDLAWPQYRVGIEVQGGIWLKAAHSTGTGIKRDMEKRNLGIVNGWRVLECEPKDLCTVELADMVRKVIARNDEF